MRGGVSRVLARSADATRGEVVPAPDKILWFGGLGLCAVVLGPLTFTPGAFALFLGLTWATLLLGHSVGMHRLLIHRSFDVPRWLERTLVYVGVLVGCAGPYGILRTHDVRDWAQREPACHPFFSHRVSLVRDLCWQLFCTFRFERPPVFVVDPAAARDRVYRFLEATWRTQQVPLAAVLYLVGGWPWVVWGVPVRIFVSVAGHWLIVHYTHTGTRGRWQIDDAGVQGVDLPGLGLVTHGECWHNNHHAFPESARIGLEPGQTDPGWWVIRGLDALGLVQRIGLPRPSAEREDLRELAAPASHAGAAGRHAA